MVEVKFKRINNCNYTPSKATLGSSGFDVQANITEPVTIKKLSRAKIPTGLVLEIPYGWEAQIRPRSGLAAKHGITLTNCVGTIDSDYRGELIILLINLGDEDYVIEPGERIAQLVIQSVPEVKFIDSESLNEDTQRADRGFGSTGKTENLHLNAKV